MDAGYRAMVDETLWLLVQRLRELAEVFPQELVTVHFPKREQLMTLLRRGDIGQDLARLVAFAEGESDDHEQIRLVLDQVCLLLFGKITSSHATYQLPLDLYESELGQVIYAVRARLVPPERLITINQVAQAMGVGQRIVHSWVIDRSLEVEYVGGEIYFDRAQVDAFQQCRSGQRHTWERRRTKGRI